jgi:hypothetical protein
LIAGSAGTSAASAPDAKKAMASKLEIIHRCATALLLVQDTESRDVRIIEAAEFLSSNAGKIQSSMVPPGLNQAVGIRNPPLRRVSDTLPSGKNWGDSAAR